MYINHLVFYYSVKYKSDYKVNIYIYIYICLNVKCVSSGERMQGTGGKSRINRSINSRHTQQYPIKEG